MWYALAEQAIADAIRESMILDTFLGLGPLPKAWIKFASHDGRTVTFALARTGIPGCWWGIGRRIDPLVSRRVYADLRRVYEHFALLNHQPSRLPRNCTWYLFAERVQRIPAIGNMH